MKIILKIKVEIQPRNQNSLNQMQESEVDINHGHLLMVRIKELLLRTLMVSIRFNKIFRHFNRQIKRKQFLNRLESLRIITWLLRKVRHPNLIGTNSHLVLQQILLLIRKIKEKHGQALQQIEKHQGDRGRITVHQEQLRHSLTRQNNYQRPKNGKLRL